MLGLNEMSSEERTSAVLETSLFCVGLAQWEQLDLSTASTVLSLYYK